MAVAEGKSPKATNGINGHTMATRSTPKKRSAARRQTGFFAWILSQCLRLATWYSLVTVLLRCPPSLDACTGDSPAICKPYFQVKQVVAPHLTPYYDAYAAPYVELATPYYETLDRHVLTPGRESAVKYGGPQLAKAYTWGEARWEEILQPQISKYQDLAMAKYHEQLAPHVEKASTVVAPYYEQARTQAVHTYQEIVLPTYLLLQPYALEGYDAAYAFTHDSALPYAVWVWGKTTYFLDTTVWPHVRNLYILKVEPQLVRIGERLGRYNTEKKAKTVVVDDVDGTMTKSTFSRPPTSVASPTSTPSSASSDSRSETSKIAETRVKETQAETIQSEDAVAEPEIDTRSKQEIAAETVAEDLELWENKFTKVAEEGALEIEERVNEISASMIEQQAHGVGKSMLASLEKTVQTELDHLKQGIVATLQKVQGDQEQLNEELSDAVRSAGLKIREQASKIRDWRQEYEDETEYAVTQAAQEHFSILQQTRDLAMSRIGMKWAWMDGVTYKDWRKYHQLRDTFDDWTEDLKRLITSNPSLIEAEKAGADVEDEAMGIAAEAAKELIRLKQVANLKAIAEDYTDNFDTEAMEAAVEEVRQRAAREAAEEAARQKAAEEAAEEAARQEAAREAAEQAAREEAARVAAEEAAREKAAQEQMAKDEAESHSDDAEVAGSESSTNPMEDEDRETSPLPPIESLTAEPTEVASDLNSRDFEEEVDENQHEPEDVAMDSEDSVPSSEASIEREL